MAEDSNKVLSFTGITAQDIPVERVCDAAKNCGQVLILGINSDGEVEYYSSFADRYQMVFMLERLKLKLIAEQGDGVTFSPV